MRAPGWLAVAVAASLLLTGCTSHGTARGYGVNNASAVDSAARAQVDRLRAVPFGPAQVGVVTDVLHTAGVGVYPAGSDGGNEPVRFMDWQVGNLAAEAANGGGVRGSTLDTMTGHIDGAPPISYLVAAWVVGYHSRSALFARALLGDQDWHDAPAITYPRLVLSLFTADAVAAALPGGTTQPAALQLRRDDAPCTAVANFIQQAIADVAAALKVDTSGGGILGFLGSIWNVAVDLAAGVVRGLLKTVQGLLLQPLVDAFALLATLDQITSYLVVWRATPQRLPETTRYGITPETVTGRVEIDVTDNQLDVPAVIRDCSKNFGSDLSKIGSAVGAPVTWTTQIVGPAGLATQTAADPTVTQAHTATFSYQTGQEPPAADPDSTATGFLKVTAVIGRYDLGPVRELFANLIHASLPPVIAPTVARLAAPILSAGTQLLADLTDVKVTGAPVLVVYHTAGASPSPHSTPPTVTAPPAATTHLPKRCPAASRISALSGIAFDLGEVNMTQPPTPTQVTCDYDSLASKIEMRLTLQKWDLATMGQPAAPGASQTTIPGADHAWRLVDQYDQEGVWVLVGGYVLAIGIAYDQSKAYFGIRLVTAILANPTTGPFIGPAIA